MPSYLDSVLHRLGPAVEEEELLLAVRAHLLGQARRKPDVALMRHHWTRVQQTIHLSVHSGDDLRATLSEVQNTDASRSSRTRRPMKADGDCSRMCLMVCS